MDLALLLPYVLLGLGVGFLVANVRVAVDLLRWVRRRRRALLTWPGPRPPFYGLVLFLGAALGALLILKLLVLQRPPSNVFGEAMMFLYFGYAVPATRRIGRGFYEDGVWAETGFMPYRQIGGIGWRAGEPPTLLFVSRLRQLARPLVVPNEQYGAVRRLLRDKIAAHDIEIGSEGALTLGEHDARDDV